jgi:hypothetical protein
MLMDGDGRGGRRRFFAIICGISSALRLPIDG